MLTPATTYLVVAMGCMVMALVCSIKAGPDYYQHEDKQIWSGLSALFMGGFLMAVSFGVYEFETMHKDIQKYETRTCTCPCQASQRR